MAIPARAPGDAFLLFSRFPSSVLREELPMRAGPGVYLEPVPTQVLDQAEPPAFADYVLPGYNVDPMLRAEYSLRTPSAEHADSGVEPTLLLFNSVTALRLCKPMDIRIEGQFQLGDRHAIEGATLHHFRSPWRPEAGGWYDAVDISLGAEIAQRQLELWQLGYRRMLNATIRFSQVTCGFSISFQMSYLGLFGALEALFVPGKTKIHKTLARRVALFLDLSDECRDWLQKEYGSRRNRLAHGKDDAMPSSRLAPDKLQALGGLHELTRLSILRFLSLEDEILRELSKGGANEVQPLIERVIEDPGAASGSMLQGQRLWCEAP